MQIDRRKGTDRETDTSVCWFTPQIAALAEARSRSSAWSPLCVAGAQALGRPLLPSQARSRELDLSGEARTRTCALTWDAGITGGGSTRGATSPASESFHVQEAELTEQEAGAVVGFQVSRGPAGVSRACLASRPGVHLLSVSTRSL